MGNLDLQEYKPKYGQDPEMFNAMYINYINQLQQDQGEESPSSKQAPAINN